MNSKEIGSWNILLVDDEPTVLRVQGQMIMHLGHVATMFSCPHDALQYMHDYGDRVDLIITDFRMPKLNGFEFIKQLRADNVDVPVLMVLACRSDVDVDELAGLGVKVIEKPAKVSVLSACIKDFHERRSLAC